MNKKRKHLNYDEFLNEELKDNEVALAYLKEAMRDKDERMFLLALKHVLDAQGENISQLAKEADLNRENLYKIFSKKTNPKWSTVNSLLHNMGFELTLKSKSK